MIWVMFTLRRFAAFLGKLLLAVAMVGLVACDDKQQLTEDLEQTFVRRARACRAACEEAAMCVATFDPWNETWGTMQKCECGPCAGLIGGP